MVTPRRRFLQDFLAGFPFARFPCGIFERMALHSSFEVCFLIECTLHSVFRSELLLHGVRPRPPRLRMCYFALFIRERLTLLTLVAEPCASYVSAHALVVVYFIPISILVLFAFIWIWLLGTFMCKNWKKLPYYTVSLTLIPFIVEMVNVGKLLSTWQFKVGSQHLFVFSLFVWNRTEPRIASAWAQGLFQACIVIKDQLLC